MSRPDIAGAELINQLPFTTKSIFNIVSSSEKSGFQQINAAFMRNRLHIYHLIFKQSRPWCENYKNFILPFKTRPN
jgi:hypothetical protein